MSSSVLPEIPRAADVFAKKRMTVKVDETKQEKKREEFLQNKAPMLARIILDSIILEIDKSSIEALEKGVQIDVDIDEWCAEQGGDSVAARRMLRTLIQEPMRVAGWHVTVDEYNYRLVLRKWDSGDFIQDDS